MNVKICLMLGALVAFGAMATGCGDACDDAKDKLEECGFPTTDSDSDEECTGNVEKYAECIADADCDAIKNGTSGCTL